MTTPNKIRTAPQTFHEVRQVMQQLGKFLHEHESVGASAAHGGTAVTAAAAFGDDLAILVADGAGGRGAKANTSLLSDGSTFKFSITNTPAVWELVSAGVNAVNWLATSNHVGGNDCIIAARGEATRGIQIWDSNNNELQRLISVASAVGYLEVTNAADTNPVLLTAKTSTTNAGMTLATSGTGVITLDAPTTLGGTLTAPHPIEMGTDKKVQFRDAAIYIHSNADGELSVIADVKTTVGAAGGPIECDEDIQPDADLSVNCGTASKRFSEGWFGDGVRTECNVANVSDPPTDAELDAAFGTPAAVGAGFMALVDDNDADTTVWPVASNGTSWWYGAKMTKAV